MKDIVLFSPIGGTDPISNFRDGAMLHICRVYQPKYVYLYLSKEMVNFHNKDDRYQYCIEKLGQLLDHTFHVELLEYEDLEEVQLFDSFIDEYSDLLRYITKQHEDCEIILNVSSGTPAMKSSLQIIGALSEGRYKTIQVSTPVRKINPHEEDRHNYDVESYWELNEDNFENFENRCVESQKKNLLDEIKRQNIYRHLKAYDYVAAISVAETLGKPLSDITMKYLQAANCRTKLDIYGIKALLGGRQTDILTVKNQGKNNDSIFEHVLNLQNKVIKEEYVDFLRGLTPVIFDLFQLALIEVGKIQIKDYQEQKIYKNSKGPIKWNCERIKENKELDTIFKNKYGLGYESRMSIVYSSNLLPCIQHFCQDNQALVKTCEELRNVEESARNTAAHEIVSVTEKWVNENTGYLPQDILKKLKRCVQLLPLGIKTEHWKSYDNMNDIIIEMIKGDR